MMSFRQKLSEIQARYLQLEECLGSPEILNDSSYLKYLQEYGEMKSLIEDLQQFWKLEKELLELQQLCQEVLDVDMRELALGEERQIKEKMLHQEKKLKMLLLPKDQDDARNIIMEIRAGTGGEEAALFVGLLWRMYRRYAECQRWQIEILNLQTSDHGGIRDISINISGKNVYAALKFEAGVHRVQRVPETEASGRLHTSTATVSILPEAEEIDVFLDEKDLRIDVFRSSGPGGQSVNTTDSAVRITHLPTGIVVQQQDEKSQHKNKAKAMKILRSRLYENQRQQQEEARSRSRQGQVGRGERCERIRTYNFPQNRLTDHRIHLTLYQLDEIIEGQDLETLIQALMLGLGEVE